jgi:hypothetical protein
MQLRREHGTSLRRFLGAALIAIAIPAAGCVGDERRCERCEYIFYWNSQGELSGSEKSCEEIACRDALCAVCYDITYNDWGRPASSTCDSCDNYEPTCGLETDYCPMHPDECAAAGIPIEACGCVNMSTNALHCGECYNVCTEGTRCVDGQCL